MAEDASQQMGERLLGGWTLLANTCTRCERVPMMRDRTGGLHCVSCDAASPAASEEFIAICTVPDEPVVPAQRVPGKKSRSAKKGHGGGPNKQHVEVAPTANTAGTAKTAKGPARYFDTTGAAMPEHRALEQKQDGPKQETHPKTAAAHTTALQQLLARLPDCRARAALRAALQSAAQRALCSAARLVATAASASLTSPDPDVHATCCRELRVRLDTLEALHASLSHDPALSLSLPDLAPVCTAILARTSHVLDIDSASARGKTDEAALQAARKQRRLTRTLCALLQRTAALCAPVPQARK